MISEVTAEEKIRRMDYLHAIDVSCSKLNISALTPLLDNHIISLHVFTELTQKLQQFRQFLHAGRKNYEKKQSFSVKSVKS